MFVDLLAETVSLCFKYINRPSTLCCHAHFERDLATNPGFYGAIFRFTNFCNLNIFRYFLNILYHVTDIHLQRQHKTVLKKF